MHQKKVNAETLCKILFYLFYYMIFWHCEEPWWKMSALWLRYIYIYIYLSVSIYLSIYLSIYPAIYLYIYLLISTVADLWQVEKI